MLKLLCVIAPIAVGINIRDRHTVKTIKDIKKIRQTKQKRLHDQVVIYLTVPAKSLKSGKVKVPKSPTGRTQPTGKC